MMNQHLASGQSHIRKIGKYLFIGILVLHTLGCYVMGVGALMNWQFAVESGFNLTYNPEFDILGVVIGMELLFLVCIPAKFDVEYAISGINPKESLKKGALTP